MIFEATPNEGRVVYLEGEKKACNKCEVTDAKDYYFLSFDKKIYCKKCTGKVPNSNLTNQSIFWAVDKFKEGGL